MSQPSAHTSRPSFTLRRRRQVEQPRTAVGSHELPSAVTGCAQHVTHGPVLAGEPLHSRPQRPSASTPPSFRPNCTLPPQSRPGKPHHHPLLVRLPASREQVPPYFTCLCPGLSSATVLMDPPEAATDATTPAAPATSFHTFHLGPQQSTARTSFSFATAKLQSQSPNP